MTQSGSNVESGNLTLGGVISSKAVFFVQYVASAQMNISFDKK